MEVRETLAAIEASEAIINTDISGIDPKYRLGRETQKAVAARDLERLTNVYRNAVLDSAFAIVIKVQPESQASLESQAEFIAIAEAEANTLLIDASDLYHRIAKKVYPSVGKDELFATTQTYLMLQEIEWIATEELGIARMPTINAPPFTVVKSLTDTANVIRNQMRAAAGDDFNKLYVEKAVVNTALSKRYNSNVVPVVVANAVPGEVDGLAKALFKGINFPVKLPANVSKDFVLKTFTGIRKKLQESNQYNPQ